MQISNTNIPINMHGYLQLSQLQVGQRLQVEILSSDANQEGVISLGGKLVRAKLEAQVQTGERFWAAVKQADENGIVLSRENLNAVRINSLTGEQVLFLMNRGLALDSEIHGFLAKFLNSVNPLENFFLNKNSNLKHLTALLRNIIPSWTQMEGRDITSLLKYLDMLGLDYEKSIYESYKSKQNEVEFSSLKYNLLKIISDSKAALSPADQAAIDNLLAEITGQQLWLQTGAGKNAYCLLHFLLEDKGEIYNCKLAVESSRQGRRVDAEHCHLALQVETPNIGLVGADLVIYESAISICILTANSAELNPLIQMLTGETKKSFARLGLKLGQLSCRSFEEYPQFAKFISGKHNSGVDLKG